MEAFERVKYLRKELLEMKQEDFSAKIKISRSNLGNIETGKVTLTERVSNDICEAFNVSPEWIQYGKEPVFIELDPDEEFAIAISELSNEHDPFIMEFIKRYWKLDEPNRLVIQSLLGHLPK